MKIKNKMFQVKVNFKTHRPGVRLSPASITGVVIAKNIEDAKKTAIIFLSREFIKEDSDVVPVIGKVTTITTKFVVDAKDWSIN